MSNKFTAWLHVTPKPSTIAESQAVYQALRKHGRLSAFIKSKAPRTRALIDSNDRTTYYTVFPREPPNLQRMFTVNVYHNLESFQDQDPFNIRGLQDRKPMPAPKSFTCLLDPASYGEVKVQENRMVKENPYHGQFEVKRNDWLQAVLVETNAPPGVPAGCARRIVEEGSIDKVNVFENHGISVGQPPPKKVNLKSLMAMWKEANGVSVKEQEQIQEPEQVRGPVQEQELEQEQKEGYDTEFVPQHRPAPKRFLSADTPIALQRSTGFLQHGHKS